MVKITFRVHAHHGASSRLLRSLALAEGLLESDPACSVGFLLSGAESACAAVRKEGHPCSHLGNGIFPSWNLEATESALGEDAPQMLVVDDANIDTRFLSELGRKTFVALMDDHLELEGYPAGAIVNPNINAHTRAYPAADSAALLLGSEFITLASEFDEYQGFERENPERARRILVDFSGPDVEGSILAAVRLLKTLSERFLAEIAVTPDFVHGEALAREIGLDERFMVVGGEAGRAKRMAAADMAICPPNMTFYESLLFGLPCALVLGSEGAALAGYSGGNGFAICLGEAGGPDAGAAKLLQGMISDKAARDRMSARTTDLVDGFGRFRLADELLGLCCGQGESI